MVKHRTSHYLLASLSLSLYIFAGYFIQRHETGPLFISYFLLFAIYVIVIRKKDNLLPGEITFWIIASVLYRTALLIAEPSLSDDFYRFIWDGRVLAAGHSPFSEVPLFYMAPENALPGLDAGLFEKLNSKERFSSYPPVCQLIYWIAARLSPASVFGSVVVMRSILIFFELGTLWILRMILRSTRQQPVAILIYALNPLVILEITGNLHFEGVMIFFLLGATYLLMLGRIYTSSLFFALSICTKLIPLLFLPLFFRPLGWRKASVFWALTGLISLALFLPLVTKDIVYGFSTSLSYYFQHFEFNASIYYLIRAVGYLLFGFNIIGVAGPVLAFMATVWILWISFRRVHEPLTQKPYPGIFQAMLWCLLIYFASTTILHPWYIITLLAISIFTPYHFPILWTGLIFLTYAGYTENAFNENLYLVALEYITVFAFICYETLWTNRKSHS